MSAGGGERREGGRTCKELEALLVQATWSTQRNEEVISVSERGEGQRGGPFFGMAKRARPARLSLKRSSMSRVCPAAKVEYAG